MSKDKSELDQAWQAVVAMVMDTRDDWRRKVVDATGLPFSRVRALKRLAPGPITLRALAESLVTDAPSATVAVNDLERRGLVTRREHPEDHRAKLVSLTPAGHAILRAIKKIPDPAPGPLSALSPEDVKMLSRIFVGDKGRE